MKKVLITGASGFFGKNLVSLLTKSIAPAEYFCLYHTNKVETKDSRFQWIKADLLDKACLAKVVNEIKPTHCIHLAWYVPPQKFWHAKENIEWLYASAHLFRIFCENGGHMFVGAGTLAEYDWNVGVLDEVNTPLNPGTLYGQCKKSLHDILQIFKKNCDYNVRLIWLRIGYFFGPDESQEKLIPKIIRLIDKDLPVDLAARDFRRPYLHVKYLARLLQYFIVNEVNQDITLNASGSTCCNLEEIVDFISNKLNKYSLKLEYDKYSSNPKELLVNNDRFQNVFGGEMLKSFFLDLNDVVESYNAMK